MVTHGLKNRCNTVSERKRMEAVMARATAPANGYPDVRMPRIRRWWDDSAWTAFAASVDERAGSSSASSTLAAGVRKGAAARIPELASSPPSNSCDQQTDPDGRVAEDQAAFLRQSLLEFRRMEHDELELELADLGNKLPTLRLERDQLQMELRDLNRQVPALTRERDELLAAVTPLRAEWAELQTKGRELEQIESEIQALRFQKASLDRELLSELRRSTESLKTTANKKNRFHDS